MILSTQNLSIEIPIIHKMCNGIDRKHTVTYGCCIPLGHAVGNLLVTSFPMNICIQTEGEGKKAMKMGTLSLPFIVSFLMDLNEVHCNCPPF